jgi:hypothetical protein
LVAAGKNPAYDFFPCQHQVFYRGKGRGVMWYEPIFKVRARHRGRGGAGPGRTATRRSPGSSAAAGASEPRRIAVLPWHALSQHPPTRHAAAAARPPQVKTLDGGEVWRRRRYRVRRGEQPGTFHLSVSDNGVTSNKFWRTLDCADDLAFCLFYYSGAASAAGGWEGVGGGLGAVAGTWGGEEERGTDWCSAPGTVRQHVARRHCL